MRKQLIVSGLTVLASTLVSHYVQAQEYGAAGPISYAVPFLTIAPDARSGAMGDVGVALSPDANSNHHNVAKNVMNASKSGLAISYSPWLLDIVPDVFLGYVAGYYKFGEGDNQAISASFRYFDLGEIEYRTGPDNVDGLGKPYELGFDIGYSRRLSENLSAGVALRYINSNIAPGSVVPGQNIEPANAVAADLGIYYTKPKQIDEEKSSTLSLGAVLRNVGSRVTYSQEVRDFLPAQLGLGASYTYQIDKFNKITGALDLTKSLVPAAKRNINGSDTTYQPQRELSVVSGIFNSFGKAPGMYGTTVGIGAEYWYQDQFAARAGYFYEHPLLGNRQYFAVGIGARYSMFGLDFSYLVPSGSGITRNPLSNSMRFTLSFDFSKMKAAEQQG